MTEKHEQNISDHMVKFLFEGAPVRGALVEAADQWQKMIQFHNYPENVASLLGQFTAGALLLSSTIKFEGSLILQVKGSGPVNLIVVEVSNPLKVRCMAQLKSDAEIKPDMDLQELINHENKGRCAIILDPKDRRPGVQPYQGIVPLSGSTVAENLENYMLHSEQLDTKLWLEATSKKIGGLLVQRMPGTGGTAAQANDPDAWGRIVQLANTVKKEELLTLTPEDILHRLFWQEKMVPVSEAEVPFDCNCSRERVTAMLKSLGRDELTSILQKDGKVSVTCQFCNNTQEFTPEEIEALFIEANPDAGAKGADPKRPQ